MTFWNFASAHPWVALLIVLALCQTLIVMTRAAFIVLCGLKFTFKKTSKGSDE